MPKRAPTQVRASGVRFAWAAVEMGLCVQCVVRGAPWTRVEICAEVRGFEATVRTPSWSGVQVVSALVVAKFV
jgi:hypothetical protein